MAAAGAAHVVTGAALGAAAKSRGRTCDPSGPGVATAGLAVSPDARAIWTSNTRRTTITRHGRDLKRGKSIDVGGAPRAIAIGPDGRQAVVTTAFYDRPGIGIVDLARGRVERVDAGAEPCAVAFDTEGERAYLTDGGTEGTLSELDVKRGRVHRSVAVGRHPRGLAVTPDGELALVAVNGGASVVLVALDRLRVVDRIKTLPYPRDIAISPNGKRAFVTHNGFGAHQVTVLDLQKRREVRRSAVGPAPSGIAFNVSGSRALVALSESGKAAVLDGRSARRLRVTQVGGSPAFVGVARNKAFVADRSSGRLAQVRL